MRKSISVAVRGRTYHCNEHGERTHLPMNHPRFSFSLAKSVKRAIPGASDRMDLCERLAPYVGEALNRWPTNPIEVQIDGHTFELSEHPDPAKTGKVLVRF